MPEASPILYTFKDLAALMVKDKGITEGHWGIFVRFGLVAGNVGVGAPDALAPAAIVPIAEIGLQRFPEPSSLTVDAATLAAP
jgi:hypothetical protein